VRKLAPRTVVEPAVTRHSWSVSGVRFVRFAIPQTAYGEWRTAPTFG
jgi:hypothetical protein